MFSYTTSTKIRYKSLVHNMLDYVYNSQSFEVVECETSHWEGGTVSFIMIKGGKTKDKINCGLIYD